MSQAYMFIDAAGSRAEYAVSEMDRDNNFPWRTDHGDRGVAPSVKEAQYRARTALKSSMEANRRSDERSTIAAYPTSWRSR